MKLPSLLGMVFGFSMCCFGLLITLGSILNMVDPESKHSFLGYAVMLFLLGVIPVVIGIFIMFKLWKRNKTNHGEVQEREMLILAKRFGGQLTVAQVAMETTYTSQEAKAILNQFHANGLADMIVTDSGEVAYEFFGVSG